MPAPKDITGMRFGRLVAVEWTGNATKCNGREWLFNCDCGKEVLAGISKVVSGNTSSCGCLNRDSIALRNTTHGYSKTKEYMSWKDMLKRCYNKNNKRYENYGAIGIVVCPEWKEDFVSFIEHVGWMPTDGKKYTVGRIDNRGNYEPWNVEWQTEDTQARAHSLQKNNTSGVVGVHAKTSKVNGVEYYSWCAVVSLFGKKKSKEFSWNKFGKEAAFKLACDWREYQLKILENQGVFYHESHGKPKGVT